MTVLKIKKYRGANILIMNNWQSFIYVIFYRNRFYTNTIDITKYGEYSNAEYLRAIDGVLLAAKETVDIIKQRSFVFNIFNQFKNLYAKIIIRFQRT